MEPELPPVLDPELDAPPLLLPVAPSSADASLPPEMVVLLAPPQLETSAIPASAPRDAAHFK